MALTAPATDCRFGVGERCAAGPVITDAFEDYHLQLPCQDADTERINCVTNRNCVCFWGDSKKTRDPVDR